MFMQRFFYLRNPSNQELCHVTEAKYLDLTLDSHLTFYSKHIYNICKKANITLGLIRRNTYY